MYIDGIFINKVCSVLMTEPVYDIIDTESVVLCNFQFLTNAIVDPNLDIYP